MGFCYDGSHSSVVLYMARKTPIKMVHYLVTDVFGNASLGDVRVAYAIGGGGVEDNGVILFHPHGKGEVSSIEFCKPHKTKRFLGKPLFCSKEWPALYVNIDKKQEDRFKKMLNDEGMECVAPDEVVVAREVERFVKKMDVAHGPRRRRSMIK